VPEEITEAIATNYLVAILVNCAEKIAVGSLGIICIGPIQYKKEATASFFVCHFSLVLQYAFHQSEISQADVAHPVVRIGWRGHNADQHVGDVLGFFG